MALSLRRRADRFVRTMYSRVLRPAARPMVSEMVTRMSYGVLTLSLMGFAAGVIFVPIAVVGGIVHASVGSGLFALWFALVSLGFALLSGGVGLLLGFIGLPFSSEWLADWPAWALALALALGGCALLPVLIFLTPVPAYASVPGVLATVGGMGYLVALALPGTRPVARVRATTRR